jgi:predicted short-subunit dehydrogenase-like oxidoreductase (DUF2520 family)
LLLEARLRQEIGEFPRADILLAEACTFIEQDETSKAIGESASFYFSCKYFHIQSKNFVRATY